MDLTGWLTDLMAGQASADVPGATAPGTSLADGPDAVAVSSARQRISSALHVRAPDDDVEWSPDPCGQRSCGSPLVLTDSTVRHLVTCEGRALAEASVGPVDTNWAMFRGRALDAFVGHVLFDGPIADPVADLTSMWTAAESTEDLAFLEANASEPGRTEELADLAASAMVFSGSRQWAPRTEVRIGAVFADALMLTGRVDVLFGGPGTGLPSALVEVKSGPVRDEHRAQLRHYVLLSALRHGESPTGAALWSPVSGLEPLHVPGVLDSASERVAAALGVLAEIDSGREPALTPGPQCRICPARRTCPAAPGLDLGERDRPELAKWNGAGSSWEDRSREDRPCEDRSWDDRSPEDRP